MDLSQKELDYLQNTDFLLTKNQITQKLTEKLGQVRDNLQKFMLDNDLNLPQTLDYQWGKISKGEKYQGLPYLVLDFPKLFKPEQIWAFRTMVWWGKTASCTLHLQGEMWKKYQAAFIQNCHLLNGQGVYVCIHNKPWDYHFETDNYLAWDEVSDFERLKIIKTHPFLKISRQLPLIQIADLEVFSLKSFQLYLESIGILQTKH
jgi:hypothetical protein